MMTTIMDPYVCSSLRTSLVIKTMAEKRKHCKGEKSRLCGIQFLHTTRPHRRLSVGGHDSPLIYYSVAQPMVGLFIRVCPCSLCATKGDREDNRAIPRYPVIS